jgi:hypothetical protein
VVTAVLAVPVASATSEEDHLVTPQEAASAVAEAVPEAVAPSVLQTSSTGASAEPTVERVGDEFVSRDTPVASTIPADPTAPIELETQSGTLALTAVGVDATATAGAVINGDAVVYANTDQAADTVVRPIATGVETFTGIRDDSAPEDYSWKVDLEGDQQLRETSAGVVEVVDPSPELDASDAGPRETEPADDASLAAAKASNDVPAQVELADPEATEQAAAATQKAGLAEQPLEGAPLREKLDDAEATPPATAAPIAEPAAAGEPATSDEGLQTIEEAAREEAVSALAEANVKAEDRTAEQREDAIDASTAQLSEPIVVAEISAPLAKDASGADVPLELSVDGSTVTMSVSHQDENFTYPIAADPYVQVTKTRVVKKCCVPIYRTEVYVASWSERIDFYQWWEWWKILQYPYRYWNIGGNWWQLNSPWGTTYYTHQPPGDWWVPAYVHIRTPHYATRTVLDRWSTYSETETYTDWEWRDAEMVFENSDGGTAQTAQKPFTKNEVGGCTTYKNPPQIDGTTAGYGDRARWEPNVKIKATFVGVKCINGTLGYQWIDMTSCLQVRRGADWDTMEGSCRGTGRVSAESRDVEPHIRMCAPGTNDYRVRVKAVSLVRAGYRETRRGRETAYSLPARDINCNEAGAYRYETNIPSKPGTLLGVNLKSHFIRPPITDALRRLGFKDRAGFEAHHIVPAADRTRRADRAQQIAYICNLNGNEWYNGVWLRGKDLRAGSAGYRALGDDGRRRALHSDMHRITHFTWLGRQMEPFVDGARCVNRTGLLARLVQVAAKLENVGAHPEVHGVTASVATGDVGAPDLTDEDTLAEGGESEHGELE